MGKISWFTCCLAAGVLFLTGCQTTYPKEHIAQALVDLCQKEYQMKVEATLNGATLAVMLEANDLFEEPLPPLEETDIASLGSRLAFSEAGSDQLEHIALSMRRVVLSTDKGIDFYHVMIRDADSQWMEFHWKGSVLDLKRLSFLDISQGDFLTYRAVIWYQVSPTILTEQTVLGLFGDMDRGAPVEKIAGYFSPRMSSEALLMFLIRNMATQGKPDKKQPWQGRATLAEIKTRQIDSETVLCFVRMLTPQKGTPPVREDGYLFVLEMTEWTAAIRQIHLLPSDLSPGGQGRWRLPNQYAVFGSPGRWSAESREVFTRDVPLPQFLAEQIARRVRIDLRKEGTMSEVAVSGGYVENEFQFYFMLSLEGTPGESPSPAAQELPDATKPQGFATVVAQTAARVLHSYKFNEFQHLSITNVDSGDQWGVSKGELPVYRRDKSALIPLLSG